MFFILEMPWLWLSLWIIGGTICVAFDSDIVLLILSAVCIFCLHKLSGINFNEYLTPTVGVWAAAYVPIGILWSFFKWYLLLRKYRDDYLVLKEEYKKESADYRERNTFEYYANLKLTLPVANKNKATICRWICYWPLSFINLLLTDLVKECVLIIYDKIGWIYDRISKSVLTGL